MTETTTRCAWVVRGMTRPVCPALAAHGSPYCVAHHQVSPRPVPVSAPTVHHGAQGVLRWHHTELGRRTDDEQSRVVRQGTAWQLLVAKWEPLAKPVATIAAAQRQAERLAERDATDQVA